MSDLSARLTIAKFNGYTSEDAQQFLDDFNAYCTFQNFKNNNPRKVAAFQLYLSGPAKIWFLSLPDYARSSWADVRTAFEAQYTTNDTSKILSYTEQFQSVRLAVNEKLETLFSKICDIGRKLEKSDMDIMLKFIECLPRELAFYVRAGNPATSAEALNAAKIGEAYGYRSHCTPQDVSLSTSPLPVGSVLEQKVDELSRQVQALKTTGSSAESQFNLRSACFRCGGPNHFQRDCNWTGGARNQDTVCQLCGQQGHSAIDCAKLHVKKCQLCNRTGHSAFNCYQRQGNGRTPSGRGQWSPVYKM